jgi:hypothetical protein
VSLDDSLTPGRGIHGLDHGYGSIKTASTECGETPRCTRGGEEFQPRS